MAPDRPGGSVPTRDSPWRRIGLIALSRLRRRKRAGRKHPENVDSRDRNGVPAFLARSSIRHVVQGVAAALVVVGLGVGGYVWHGWTVSDAIYMVVITISGVGYGEIRPIRTPAERVLTIAIITFGMAAVGYTLARFIQFLTEGEIQNLVGHHRMHRQIDMLSGHTIVAGYGRVGELVCHELREAEIPVVVIELDPKELPELENKGLLYVAGDATEESVLREAGLERAKTLVTVMPNDAANVFITLTARDMAPSVMIVARAELPSSQKKLKQAGANHVVLPASIGAHRIVSLLTNPSAVEFAELVTHRSSLAIEMDDIPIRPGSPLGGLTLRDADVGRRTGLIVIALKRSDGRVQFPPPGDEPLAAGDSVVVLGRRTNLDQFRKLFEA